MHCRNIKFFVQIILFKLQLDSFQSLKVTVHTISPDHMPSLCCSYWHNSTVYIQTVTLTIMDSAKKLSRGVYHGPKTDQKNH